MNPKRIGIIMALAWIVIRQVLFNLGLKYEAEIGIVINILFLLIIIFVAVRAHYQQERNTIYLDNVKAGMRQAGLYSLLISVYLFAHYKWIDPSYLQDKIDARVIAEEQKIEKIGWDAFVEKNSEQDPTLEEKSREDYIDDVRKSASTFLQPSFILALSLVSLVSISFIYSMLIAAVYRKFLYKYDNYRSS